MCNAMASFFMFSDATRSLILEILCAILDGYFVFFGLTEELQEHVKELKNAMDFSKLKGNEKHLNNLIGIIIKVSHYISNLL